MSMTNLDFAESDADKSFWYDPAGNPVQPCSNDPPRTMFSPDKKHWIEIGLFDEDGNPVPGQAYKISFPDGTVQTGNLDSRGLARVDGIDPGICRVTFPDLVKPMWNRFDSLSA